VVTERIKSVRDLVVYKKAFDAAMRIFEISEAFGGGPQYLDSLSMGLSSEPRF
jgi:hypothetical protein